MIQVGTLDARCGAFGDSTQFLDGGFTASALKTFVALPQGLSDGAGHCFPGFLGDSLGEPVGLGVLDIEAHGVSRLPYHYLPFFIITRTATYFWRSYL